MIKRIITGIIVGTALMFVGRSMPKAYTLNNEYNTPFVNPVSVSQNTESYSLDNYSINVGGEQVAEVIDTTKILDVNNKTLSGYTILNNLTQYDNYLGLYPVIAQNDATPTKFIVGNYQNPIWDNSEQTNLFFEFDTATMPFQVKNIFISCNDNIFCMAVFSKGDLPTFEPPAEASGYPDTMTLNSDSMIFTWGNERKTRYLPTRYYYSAILGYENDVFNGHRIYDAINPLSANWKRKSYVSTAPITVGNYDYESNYSNIQFYVNWSIINSAHEDNSEYGSDKKVTSYSVAFEPTPWDLSEYNYYYLFTTDYNDLPPLSEWGQMTAKDKGIGVLANLKQDGYVYLRITDKNNNVIYNDLFTTGEQIGKTMIFPNDDIQNKSFINGLVSDLDYGGPISSIVLIPVNIVQGLLTAMSSTCATYHNGTLLGKHIDFPCVTLQSIVGSNLTHIIDVIGAFSMAIGFIAMVVEIYRKATALEDLGDYHTNTVRGLAYSIYRR